MADPELRREYEDDIAPRTRAALARIFADIAPVLGPGPVVRRALDLGAGTGAGGDAVRAFFGADVQVLAVDRVAAPGVIGADLRREVRPRGVDGRFDLIVAAHVLNELGRTMTVEARAALVFAWCRELLAEAQVDAREPPLLGTSVEGGLCVLLEPALRETSRDLLAIRDRLVAAGLFVLAPCLTQAPCPALARDRDWCHDAAPWNADEAERRAGRSRVDFSYLVIARKGARAADRRLFRAVSDPLKEKGRLRLYGCGPGGRHAFVRLDRERSEENADFDRVSRGDVFVAAGTERAGDGLRVLQTTRVERRSNE